MDNTGLPWERGTRPKGSNMNIKAMTRNMLDFKEAMDRANIPFILIFGSLLGAIRERGFIPYDSDADVACFADDHRKIHLVVKELEEKGFYVPNKNEIPLHDHFFIRDKEKIDIWWFLEINNLHIYDPHIQYESHFFKEPKTISFLGTDFLVPNKPLDFLDITYGKGWTEPLHINDPRSNYILDMTQPGGRRPPKNKEKK